MIWLAPQTLAEALDLCAERSLRIFAGGTDLFPERAATRAAGDRRDRTYLDLAAIPGLRDIARDQDGWRIGCLVTWTDLLRSSLPPQFDGLRQAARELGAGQVQNRGTLVGNLVTASPAGDGIPCLMALEAEVELTSLRGARRVPVRDFILARRSVDRFDDEIVTALIAPARPSSRGAFRKLGARRYLVISIAMASAVIDTTPAGRIVRARIVVGACSQVAQRLPSLEAAVTGRHLDPSLSDVVESVHVQHLTPLDDMRSSALYRREAARQIVSELLLALSFPTWADAA